mmetsp:Transcript_42234/g.132262  ORF Transcript_42234/g.132262 Transcript_42234/m.132262 type:complete len:205 (+) Transcript_42234:179-793(+)
MKTSLWGRRAHALRRCANCPLHSLIITSNTIRHATPRHASVGLLLELERLVVEALRQRVELLREVVDGLRHAHNGSLVVGGLHAQLDAVLERVRRDVAREAHGRVAQELEAQQVAERVVLAQDRERARVRDLRVLRVRHLLIVLVPRRPALGTVRRVHGGWPRELVRASSSSRPQAPGAALRLAAGGVSVWLWALRLGSGWGEG